MHLTFCAPIAWTSLNNSKTVSQAVKLARHLLARSHVPEPAASSEYLAVVAFDNVKSRREATRAATRPTQGELHKYISLCKQREETHVPVQYLVGNWDFHDITLNVRAPVLIPRPETEELVELVLADKQLARTSAAKIIDVGCGSGAIMLALLQARSRWSAFGIDISPEAVSLTRENIANLQFERRAEARLDSLHQLADDYKFDGLVSNPPYISFQEIASLDRQVREHEDIRALCGGEDGLDIIKDILQHAPRLVKSGGSVWMEVECAHPNLLQDMETAGLEFVNKYSDLSGNPRFCQWRVL